MDIFWTFYLNHLSPLWGYFCDDEEEDELILDDGRDDCTDDFCDDNGGFW